MPDGFTYDGEWQNGEISGAGIATYANGDVYEGSFINGRREGQGTMRYANGVTETGEWRDGALDVPAPDPGATAEPATAPPPAEAAIDPVPSVDDAVTEPAAAEGADTAGN
jgi:hypothetical protein